MKRGVMRKNRKPILAGYDLGSMVSEYGARFIPTREEEEKDEDLPETEENIDVVEFFEGQEYDSKEDEY